MVVDGDYVGEIVATSLLGLRLVFVMLPWQVTVHSQSITSIPPRTHTVMKLANLCMYSFAVFIYANKLLMYTSSLSSM